MMKVVHGLLDPIIQQGVQRSKLAQESKATALEMEQEEGETVLDHLIKHTDGKHLSLFSPSSPRVQSQQFHRP